MKQEKANSDLDAAAKLLTNIKFNKQKNKCGAKQNFMVCLKRRKIHTPAKDQGPGKMRLQQKL
jgi:hypothetical protein